MAIPSSHNVSVDIKIFAFRDSPGSVYCLATMNGRIPISVGEVKSKGISKQFVIMKNLISMLIPNLLALASYKVYCYVELSDGTGSTYADVISTSQVFHTSCCHEVSFSYAPVSVYGNMSLYSSVSGNSDLSSKVFSYSLESAPISGSITITPIITFLNGLANNYSLVSVPSSFEFRSFFTGSQLRGQFYLNAASAVSGVFLVSLLVSGRENQNFTTASTIVHILSAHQPLSAPRLLSCIFDSSGGYFVVTFDKSTDQAGITEGTWMCSRLFNFVDISGTTCSWTSLSTAKVIFSKVSKSSLKPGDLFTIKGALLRAACVPGTICINNHFLESGDKVFNNNEETSAVSDYSTVVQRPTYPITPTVILQIPRQIGGATDLLVDFSVSTGSGGRPWSSIVWNVLAETGNGTILRNYLKNASNYSSFFTVPRSILLSTTYSIGISLTSFLGDSASTSSLVTVMDDPNLPVVLILGLPFITMKASNVLSLQGTASMSQISSFSSLNYTWTLTNSTGALMTSTYVGIDPRKYVASAYSLTAGSTYRITLTVTSLNPKGLKLSSAQATTRIYVTRGEIIAAIRGGYARENVIDKILTLDASISSDEDTSTGSKGLLFSWSCTIASLVNFGSRCNFNGRNATNYSSSVFTLPANLLVLHTKYSFVVEVTSADGRYASQTVLITPSQSSVPILFSNNTRAKFNEDSTLVIPGTIITNFSAIGSWTAFYDGVPINIDRNNTQIVREFTVKNTLSSISYPLAVAPYTFVAGRKYTFRMSAYPLDDITSIGYFDVVLTVNSPPIGGYASISPLKGYALMTDFTIVSTGWTDDISDYPLSYSFSYQLAVSDVIPALVLTVLSPVPHATSQLPPGLLGGTYL